MVTIEQIDSTMLALCSYIQEEIKVPSMNENNHFLPEMIKALAKLIVARAEM